MSERTEHPDERPTEPPAGRPGGRTARVREAVLAATGDVLAESGIHRLDLTDIAQRAGVGKTTVYRRWGSVPALVADLLSEMARESVSRTETGKLLGDLEANALLVQRTLTDPRQGRLFRAVIAAATYDEHTAEALQRFYDLRIAEWVPCVDAALDRGEIPEGTDPAAVIMAVSAPLYYRLLTRIEPPTRTQAVAAARAAYAAATAGVFIVEQLPSPLWPNTTSIIGRTD